MNDTELTRLLRTADLAERPSPGFIDELWDDLVEALAADDRDSQHRVQSAAVQAEYSVVPNSGEERSRRRGPWVAAAVAFVVLALGMANLTFSSARDTLGPSGPANGSVDIPPEASTSRVDSAAAIGMIAELCDAALEDAAAHSEWLVPTRESMTPQRLMNSWHFLDLLVDDLGARGEVGGLSLKLMSAAQALYVAESRAVGWSPDIEEAERLLESAREGLIRLENELGVEGCLVEIG